MTVTTVEPSASGSISMPSTLDWLGPKLTGLPTIAATDGVPLLTPTLTVRPPRTGCVVW